MARSHRWIVGAVAVAAALLLAATFWPRNRPPVSLPNVAAAPTATLDFESRRATPPGSRTMGGFGDTPDGVMPLAEAAAHDYRKRAEYPDWSFAIEDEVDPLERDRSVSPQKSHPADWIPVLIVEPAQVSFEAPRPVVIRARLEGEVGLDEPRSIRGDIRDSEGNPIASVRFEDGGEGADEAANDLLYTAEFTPGSDGVAEMQGAYLIEVISTVKSDPEPRVAVSGFLYSVPKATLTGRFRDRIVGGSLQIDAEIDVFEAGRFHVEATLAASTGRALAWAQEARRLGAGMHWIPLRFYGLALRRSEIDGPYSLRSIALQSTDEMPARKSDLVVNAHVTAFYRANEFTRESFDHAGLIEAAERLERGAGFVGSLNAGGAPAVP